jgi:hypothetical protein
MGVRWSAMKGPSRTRPLSQARAVLAYTWMRYLGRSGRVLAQALNVTPQAVYDAVARMAKNPPSASKMARWTA